MAVMRSVKKTTAPALHPYAALVIHHSPVLGPVVMALFFIILIMWPVSQRLSKLSTDIKEKENIIMTVKRGSIDVKKTKKELEEFKIKVVEFEKRLPPRIKTNLIIETLQEITQQSKLKFSSLEPAPVKKYELKETKDMFIELPVRIRLKCGYYDLVDFLEKIEAAKQLMKISELSIRDDPGQDWDHNIEFLISAYSRGDSSDYR